MMRSTQKILRVVPWAILAMIGVARGAGLQGSGSDARLSGAATGLSTTGGVVDVSGSSAPSAGNVLVATDATHATWTSGGGGGVTSLAATTPVAVSGSTGSVTVSIGTVPYNLGGTGQTSYAKGDLVYASATNTLSKLAAGTDGYVLTLASGAPTWAVGGGGGGGSGYPLSITAKTTGFTATSNSFYNNSGASGAVTATLPSSPSVGDVVGVFVVVAQKLEVLAPASTSIYFGTTSSGAAGYFESTAIGSSVLLVYAATNTWIAYPACGLWTPNA